MKNILAIPIILISTALPATALTFSGASTGGYSFGEAVNGTVVTPFETIRQGTQIHAVPADVPAAVEAEVEALFGQGDYYSPQTLEDNAEDASNHWVEPAMMAARPKATPARAPQRRAESRPQVGLNADEARFLQLVNVERQRRGLKPLTWDESLTKAGRHHSKEMADLRYFDHKSPNARYRGPADRYESYATDIPMRYTIGENLLQASRLDHESGHRALMESPAHRENILDPKWEKVGIGVHVNESGATWVTQMFLG